MSNASRTALAAIALCLANTQALYAEPANGTRGFLEELASVSVGSFSTHDQARRDERYGVAEAEIVRIWPDRDDGMWLYQEQAFLGERWDEVDPGQKDRPYFARVIHSVETAPGVVRRSVHKLKDPDAARGTWRAASPLEALSPDDLLPSECGITAERIAEGFWRSQSDKCPNAYKGADYALSISLFSPGRYANWDRGLKVDGAHVWGPEAGGYIFVRRDK
ncbi:MAG: hypothetical protein GC152_08525 [Alphaproteobacteria bacterium]|nr:hypothetical protein [Alphaproteobacteria bacterium]